MKKKKYKKGALSVKVLIGIIILILSFGIILFFYHQFYFKSEADVETCHQSVIYKATIPTDVLKSQLDLPLNCETQKICISPNWISKGNCDEDFLGEKYKTVRISKDRNKWEKEINAIIAEKLRECWWMMGEGKVQIYSRGWGTDLTKIECYPCVRIAFDKKIKDALKEELAKNTGKDVKEISPNDIKIKGLIKYLTTHIVPNTKKTYWQYITNQDSNYIYTEKNTGISDEISLTPKAIIFMEVGYTRLYGDIGKNLPILVGGALGSFVPIVGTTIGRGIGAYLGKGVGDWLSEVIEKKIHGEEAVYAVMVLKDYNYEELKKLKCTSFRGRM